MVRLTEQGNGWWFRLMTEFPFGEYADMAARFLIEADLLRGRVLELGAGIGNTSRKICDRVVAEEYIRTDVNPLLLMKYPVPSKPSYCDFNRPGKWTGCDLVFGTNTLHCAANKIQSLRYIHDMLAPGGYLVLSEGAPRSKDGTLWLLTFWSGIYDGWWDQSGFLSREQWTGLLVEAGFVDIGGAVLSAGAFDLGGLIWCRRPSPAGPR